MPKILGLEPEFVHKAKPFFLVGGGALVLYLVVKSRSATPIAASAPSGAPMQAVSSPAAQPELSAGQQTASALQSQLQAQQGALDQAAQALGLKSREQQLSYQGQQNAFSLQREQTQAAQADAITHENFKQLKKKGQTGGFLGDVMGFINQAAQDVGAFTGAVNTASQAAQAVQNFGVPSVQKGATQPRSPSLTSQAPSPQRMIAGGYDPSLTTPLGGS